MPVVAGEKEILLVQISAIETYTDSLICEEKHIYSFRCCQVPATDSDNFNYSSIVHTSVSFSVRSPFLKK